ncbi:MAG: Riboflavin biosynthesis protein RibD [Candidatus Omnitrophica bacterium]|nr:Riboflavin biosynthesis protein RibD [Candidatus Omnitrophota bacterium]
MTSSDARWMREALKEAAAVPRGRVRPNPSVGAVVVRRRRIVGRGAHLRYGGPHAEIHALKGAGRSAVGATLYVTLEPCAHHGKTPPCVDAILASGVRRVVCGLRDPHPLVDGRGLRRLRRAGLAVTTGVLEAECRALNLDWVRWVETGRPYTIVKIARSLDGHSRVAPGGRGWITGPAARRWAHRLRSACDAILVGSRTLRIDDPLLSVRHGYADRQPLKVILDRDLRAPLRARIFSKASPGPVLLVARQGIPAPKKRRYRGKADIVEVPLLRDGRLDLSALFRRLGERGVTSVLVEGGEKTLASVLEAGLADEMYVFIAPKVLGGGAGLPGHELSQISVSAIGRDLVLYGRL